jgi:hypothetical protein
MADPNAGAWGVPGQVDVGRTVESQQAGGWGLSTEIATQIPPPAPAPVRTEAPGPVANLHPDDRAKGRFGGMMSSINTRVILVGSVALLVLALAWRLIRKK